MKINSKTMMQEEYYQKTDECVAKFKNGKARYQQSATFNRVIQMLVRDADPMEIIDQLVTITDDTQKAFEQYMLRDTRPMKWEESVITINLS